MFQRFAFATMFGGAICLAFWLFTSQTSPLHDWVIWHPGPKNFLAQVSLPAILLGVLVSGNVHQPSSLATYIAMWAQWGILGYLVSLLLFRRKTRA